MKKILIGLLTVALFVAVLGTVSTVSAQGGNPPAQNGGTWAPGAHMGGGMMLHRTGEEGPLHEYMIAAFADALGIDAATLESRIEAGETMGQIAADQGKTWDEFRALMLDARAQAVEQALADGVITQEQADWMSQRGAGRGAGRGMGRGMGMGGGYFGDCPMLAQ